LLYGDLPQPLLKWIYLYVCWHHLVFHAHVTFDVDSICSTIPNCGSRSVQASPRNHFSPGIQWLRSALAPVFVGWETETDNDGVASSTGFGQILYTIWLCRPVCLVMGVVFLYFYF
jgi:hypothetical protein